MFRISNNGFAISEANDTHDIYDIFLGITGEEETAQKAWEVTSQMVFGDKKEVAGYLIEQFDETEEVKKMFIRLNKLTGKPIDNDWYINTDQIINYGPDGPDESTTIICFTNDRKAIIEKSPRDVTDILRDCGVEVRR